MKEPYGKKGSESIVASNRLTVDRSDLHVRSRPCLVFQDFQKHLKKIQLARQVLLFFS